MMVGGFISVHGVFCWFPAENLITGSHSWKWRTVGEKKTVCAAEADALGRGMWGVGRRP